MSMSTCTSCGAPGLEPGFISDTGQYSKGVVRWIAGRLELGVFGGARVMRKPRLAVSASRCRACGHLELFAVDPV